jgi:hypothetical protein
MITMVEKTSQLFIKDNNFPLPFRLLKETDTYLQIMKSLFTKVIHDDDYITIEHCIVLVPQNLPVHFPLTSQQMFSLSPKGFSLDLLFNTCEVESKDKTSPKECKATQTFEGGLLNLNYNFTVFKGDNLIFHYKYKYIK